LHAIGGLVFDSVAFKNVINLGHIQDAEGKKMSKSKGNAVDPWEVLGKHGADAFRWYLYTAGPPGESRRFSVDLVGEVVKKFWSTLWNTYSFFVTYANIDEWTPESVAPPVAERDALDRWVLAALHQLVERVTAGYEDYDAPGVTRPVQTFVEMLSNWYVRLSRRRFWKSESDAEKLGAYATLYQCLVTVSKLIAPTMPFLSEAIYRNLVAGVIQNAPDSVHLAEWPEHDASLIDETLLKEMSLVQNLVSVGLAARNSARMRVRQPLASVEFAFPEDVDSGAIERFADLITSELNVKRVGTRSVDEASKLLSTVYTLSPSPRLLGKKLGKDFQRVNSALKEGEQDFVQPIAEALLSGENASFEVDGAVFEVTPEEVEIQSSPEVADGYGVADDNGYWAVVETTLTDELIREGLAREIVRRVQTVRRDADFNIDDRIILRYETSSEELTQAIEQFVDYIRHETLCDSLEVGLADDDGFYRQEFTPESRNAINGQSLVVGVKRVEG
jgi:isoleucyl-tRNA synthetase